MIVRAKFKDPDTMPDAVKDQALRDVRAIQGLTDGERMAVLEVRVVEAREQIGDLWMEYDEYITVEFDTNKRTARVVPKDEELSI